MARGGKRPGAGRPPGTVNKRSAAAAAKVKASGSLLPHEWLLGVMNGAEEIEAPLVDKAGNPISLDGGQVLIVKRKPTIEERIKAALGAAPFYAPKLQAIAAVTGPEDKNPIATLMAMVAASDKNRAKVA